MRITIIGENDTARALRALLRKARFAVGDCRAAEAGAQARAPLGGAGYSISIEESAATGWIHLDSVASELEAAVFHHVAELSPHPVSVDRPGGQVHHERELRIVVPADDPAQAQAVEYGVLRGLLELIGPDDADDPDAQSPKAPGPPRRAGADGSALPGEPRVDAAQPQAAQRGLWKRIIGVLPLLLLCAATLLAAPRTPP
ncbi:MAG TPA: hypothetical protein VEH49_04315, partial [Methylomirabilota bacterium]|nr:hypothetical protein [Methylomirabilota bacterium]